MLDEPRSAEAVAAKLDLDPRLLRGALDLLARWLHEPIW